MKIVMLCEFFDENLEFQENLLVKYYSKHGHQVSVITSTFDNVFDYYSDRYDSRKKACSYQFGGAKIIKLPYRYNLLNRLRAYTSIDQILRDERPDLIYVHDISPNFPEAISYVRQNPGVRMIMDYHADYSNSGKNALSLKVLHGVLRKWFLDRARPYLSRIFPVVPASATFLNEVYGVPSEEMELLPLGADTDRCEEVRRSGAREELRAAHGVGESEIVVFSGGKLTPAKKTEVLIRALSLLPELPLRVVIAGEAGPKEQEYRSSLVREAKGDPRVELLGWLSKDDMYRYMAMADLAVFPASQSVVWQQAIAMGLPLIVGNVGHQDISYLNLHDNIVMLQSERITEAGLAEAMSSVLTTPGRLRGMSEGALRVAAGELNYNRLIERTLRFSVNAGAS